MQHKYRRLNPDKIVATIAKLQQRIIANIGDRGLTQVSAELATIASDAKQRVVSLRRPIWFLRLIPVLVALLLAYLVWHLRDSFQRFLAQDLRQVSEALQRLLKDIAWPAAVSLPIPFIWAGIAFMATLESRWKRRTSLRYLHELRSIIHVIDMHQLTKDLHRIGAGSGDSDHIGGDKLILYLDYCSELLSLCAKVAALYAESSRDAVIIEAVSDLGQITSNLSNKIWQKINLVERRLDLPRRGYREQDVA
jgi:hypothetical protein